MHGLRNMRIGMPASRIPNLLLNHFLSAQKVRMAVKNTIPGWLFLSHYHGFHDLPNSPKKRNRRNKKAVNIQLISWSSEQSSEQNCFEIEEEPNLAVAARINRKRDYTLSRYKGKYRDVLSLILLGLPTKNCRAVWKNPAPNQTNC